MPTPIQIIVNPNAAGGRGGKIIPDLRRLLDARGLAYRLRLTERPGHARQMAGDWNGDGSGRFLVVGGDGTLHEVVNGLLHSRGETPALAVLPVGTGNDFHRMVRGSGELPGVLSILTSGVVRPFDVGRVRWAGGQEYFVNLLGLGIDVAVLRRRSRFQILPGLMQYLAALAAAAVSFRTLPVSVEAESAIGEEIRWTGKTLLTAITVGPSVGGGFLLSPDARPDDQALDLFLAGGLGLTGVLRHLPSVLRGTHRNIRQVHMHQIRRARIQSTDDTPLHFELDGELMPDPSPWLEVEVVPEVLRILDQPSGHPARVGA